MDRETREALRFFSQEHERSFLSLEGRGRVLLSAPHAVLFAVEYGILFKGFHIT